MYESVESGRRLMPLLPVCIRVDGKCFHSYTHRLASPYDERLSNIMVAVAKSLVRQTNAKIGYTQSDEINLVLYSDKTESQIFFDGKIQKVVSVVSSMATAEFNSLRHVIPELKGPAFFDCRAWNVPTLQEAANVILWRELDATRNSIQSAARAYYSHKQCNNKSTGEMQEMLFQKGVNWNDYPDFFKRGTFVIPKKFKRLLTPEELERIPEHHRPPPGTEFERGELVVKSFPPLFKISNRVDVLFGGAGVILAEIDS